MPKSKFFMKSLTVWGAIVGFVPPLLAAFGVEMPPELVAKADESVKALIAAADEFALAIGAVMVIVGRVRAGGLSFGLEALKGRSLNALVPYVALPLVLALPLGACGLTSSGDFARGAVAEYGSKAMDEGLVNAEFFVCRAASVGSVIRRYGRSKETAEAWKTLCQGDADVDIIEESQPSS